MCIRDSTDSEDEISYMELKQKADCLAAAFLRKGILKGDKVLSLIHIYDLTASVPVNTMAVI